MGEDFIKSDKAEIYDETTRGKIIEPLEESRPLTPEEVETNARDEANSRAAGPALPNSLNDIEQTLMLASTPRKPKSRVGIYVAMAVVFAVIFSVAYLTYATTKS